MSWIGLMCHKTDLLFLNADIYYNLSFWICVKKTTCRLFICTINISAHAIMLNKTNNRRFDMAVSSKIYPKGGSTGCGLVKGLIYPPQAKRCLSALVLLLVLLLGYQRGEGWSSGCNRPKGKVHKLHRCFTDTWELKDNLQKACQSLWFYSSLQQKCLPLTRGPGSGPLVLLV